jgi:hypothetical protein
METTTCDVQQSVRHVDAVDGLLPMPTNIKVQMPDLASMLQQLAANVGRDTVQRQLQASVDLRHAYDADDYRAVNAVYRRGDGWVSWSENGYCVGVPSDVMAAFAKRHRGGR